MIEHTTPADGNVFAAIGFPPEEAENLLIRCDLMLDIEEIIRTRGLKQAAAAKLFGVSQPRISELKRRKLDAFTIDALVNMLATAGFRVDISVRPIPASEYSAAGASEVPAEAEVERLSA
jgi:predicted XRE-type DNA-binding protein